MRRILILALFTAIMLPGTTALFVGVSPGTNDIGTVERGETIEVEFYIQTNYEGDLTLEPKVNRPSTDIMINTSSQYGINPSEYSQEVISDWFSFREPEYFDNRQISTDDGGTATVDGRISYFLDIPRDAEPGYHVAVISLNPELDNKGGTINALAVSNHQVIFRVPGDAERSVEVVDIRGLRTGDRSIRMEADVRNTGTVTTSVRSTINPVFTSKGQKTAQYTLGGEYIEPGETKTITSGFNSGDESIKAGNYQTRGQLDYITGQAFYEESFAITDYIQIESAGNGSGGSVIPGSGPGGSDSPPIMLIFMALVLSGSLMYAFNIDPLLIIMMIGVISISSVIWFTAIPTSMVGLVVLLSAGLFYYGWM